ncbi:MAG: hypothetical protein OEV44_08510 [Spirochaetota bacterium]|nr:hypothetical protein [Spirochaetota bacterium]
MLKIKYLLIKAKFLSTLISITILTFLLSANPGFTRYNLQYFDATQSKPDYRGIVVLKNQINNTTKYIYNGWPYYIAYADVNKKVKKLQLLKNGNITSEEYYYYSKKSGEITKIKAYVNDSHAYTSFYDNNPLKFKRVFIHDRSYIIYHFTDNKKLKQVEKYDKYGRIITSTNFTYDENSHLIKQEYFDSKKRILESVKFHYNVKGLKVRSDIYSSTNKLLEFSTYHYNQYGQIIESKRYNSKSLILGSKVYEYDDKGQIRYVLHYDNQGRLIVR